MPTLYPPDGWEIVSGTWGTDIDRDESTYLTSGASIKIPQSGTGAKIRSMDRMPVNRRESPIVSNNAYSVLAVCRSASIANSVVVGLDLFNASLSYIGSTSIYNAPLAASASWETRGGHGVQSSSSTAYYVSPFFSADGTQDVWLDELTAELSAPFAHCSSTIERTIDPGVGVNPIGGWDVNSSCLVDLSDIGNPAFGYAMRILEPGRYSAEASMLITAPSECTAELAIRWYQASTGYNYFAASVQTINGPTTISVSSALNSYTGSDPGGLGYGDLVHVYFRHNGMGPIYTEPEGFNLSGRNAFFSIHRLGR